MVDWFTKAVQQGRITEISYNDLEMSHEEDKLKGGMGKLDIAIWKTKEKRVVIKKVTYLSETKLHFIYEVSEIHFWIFLSKFTKLFLI